MLVLGGERSATMVLLQKKMPACIQPFLLSAVGRLPSDSTLATFVGSFFFVSNITKFPVQNENQGSVPEQNLAEQVCTGTYLVVD